jgi:CubicO group peptidase (beta-lactamase class C family)
VLLSRGLGHATGYALEDEEPATPMTPRTPLCLYSGAKAMTAVLVHRLVEDGLVDLDAPVTTWIEEFGQRGKGGITVRHLLTHRAGISRVPMKVGDDVDRMLDHDTMLARLCASPADTRPGASQAYHAVTAGFVLGEIAQRAAGKPLPELLRTVLAEPLGAWSLTYGHPDDSPHTPARSASTGPRSVPGVSGLVDRLLGTPAALLTPTLEGSVGRDAVVPAGNVYASAEEASRFMQLLLDGGSWDGHRVLRPETVAAALTPAGRLVVDGSFPAPIRFTPGFMLGEVGVSLFGWQAPQAFGHLGFTTILLWADPERELSAAVCTTGKSLHPVALTAFAAIIGTISLTIPRSARV